VGRDQPVSAEGKPSAKTVARGYGEREREAEREAARQVELAALAVKHKKRVAAAKKEHEAGVRRQKKLLRELGVPDLSPEEVTERARRCPASVSHGVACGSDLKDQADKGETRVPDAPGYLPASGGWERDRCRLKSPSTVAARNPR
jgi:hypothetical protein